jgi:uncharacterized SAM-binding protein YcdF (DUF218 family)
MFILKKYFSRLLFPVPLSLELLILGQVLLWLTRRQKTGRLLVGVGTALLLVLSNHYAAGDLLRTLERRYPPIQASAETSSVKYIVVLGGYGNDDPKLPMTGHISPDLMTRLIEGTRLHRQIPGSKLILSGGKDSADGMAAVAEALGVQEDDILQLSNPPDTEDESKQTAAIVGSQEFILVTSASHMLRAMGFFRKRGLQPLAAPTDYLAPRDHWESDDFFPDAYNLFKSQVAFYEYLGLAWEKLRGGI